MSDDARYEEHDKMAELNDGALLLEENGGYSLQMPLSEVNPRSHSLIFARAAGGCDHIFVLLGNAFVKVGRHVSQLHAGEELVVADHETKPAELISRLYQDDNIGRRRLQMDSLPGNRSIGMVEFSLVQAVEREPMIYKIMHSSDPHDRSLRDRLIKMAAVLNLVTGSHGMYIPGR
ncbi:MAG TPA: hypothetical protein V6D22_04865 [Candidatus Obscuribacterales bacterium]